MLKEAIQYLVDLGNEKYIKEEINGFIYTNKNLSIVKQPMVQDYLSTCTLTSIIDYIINNVDDVNRNNIVLHIQDHRTVVMYKELNNYGTRETLMIATAFRNDLYKTDYYMDTETFNIMLQSSFVSTIDRDLLLKVTSNIKEENVKNTGDDGISQIVTIKSGIASVATVVAPNPVVLAPYRTFREIEQPESKFIFRLRSGKEEPTAALILADGNEWKLEALEGIKSYLAEHLREFKNVKILS